MNKDKYIGLRVTEESYNEIKDFCSNYGMSVSDFLRLILDGELEKYGKYKGLEKSDVIKYINQTNKLIEEAGKVEWEVNKIGVNINQLVKKGFLNSEEKKELISYLDRLETLTKNFMEAIWQSLM